MTKKTIIFDTDDESKGHYPSDEAYAPLEVGKVYNVTEDVTNKNVVLSPVDANSDLPTMELGVNGLHITKNEKRYYQSLLKTTAIVNGNKHEASILENGDIIGDKWVDNKGGGKLLSYYIQYEINTAIEHSVAGNPSSGWTRLNNGLLLQWGAIVAENNSSVGTITFPTAFTTTCSFVAQTYGAVTGPSGVAISCLANDNNSLTSQKIRCIQIQTGQVVDATAWYVKWIAIGY